MENMNRRYFILRGLFCLSQGAIALVGLNWILSACSDNSPAYGLPSSNPTTGGNCDANGTPLETTGSTESHTHTIQLSSGAIVAANPNAIFVTSNVDGHTHNVQLNAGQYSSLQSNQGFATFTGPALTDGHIHTITFNCA